MIKRRRRKQEPLPLPIGFIRETHLVAVWRGTESVESITIGGLGLRLVSSWKCRNVKKDGTRTIRTRYGITHLGSGHSIGAFECSFDQAVQYIREIAALDDWTFDGLYGWLNFCPELPDKYKAWAQRHKLIIGQSGWNNEAIAQTISQSRW